MQSAMCVGQHLANSTERYFMLQDTFPYHLQLLVIFWGHQCTATAAAQRAAGFLLNCGTQSWEDLLAPRSPFADDVHMQLFEAHGHEALEDQMVCIAISLPSSDQVCGCQGYAMAGVCSCNIQGGAWDLAMHAHSEPSDNYAAFVQKLTHAASSDEL